MDSVTQAAPGQGVVGMSDSVEADVAEVTTGSARQVVEAFIGDSVRPTTRAIYLVGCGGSLFMFGAMGQILERSPIPCITINADELMAARPATLGPDSIVIASSTFGGTQETARAIEFAQHAGAPTLLITQRADSVCGRAANTTALHTGVEAKQVLLALTALALLRATSALPESDYEQTMQVLAASGPAFRRSVDENDGALAEIARACSDQDCVHVLGAGGLEGAAQTLAACYFMEMQQQHAVAMGAGEFLHGPFEMAAGNLPVIVLENEDATSTMTDRVLTFLRRYNEGGTQVISVKGLSLPGVPATQRALVGSLVLSSSTLARLAQHLERISGRPLRDRKYMWKVDY